MATPAQIRTGLKNALKNILTVYELVPDSINVPCVVIKRAGAHSHLSFDNDAVMNFELTVVVQINTLDRAQTALDTYTAPSGTKSIVAALEVDESLGGYAEYLDIGNWGEDQSVRYVEGGPEYVQAVLPVSVYFRS